MTVDDYITEVKKNLEVEYGFSTLAAAKLMDKYALRRFLAKKPEAMKTPPSQMADLLIKGILAFYTK